MNSIMVAVLKYVRDALDFKGRTSRADFWWAFLVLVLLGSVLGGICALLGVIGKIIVALWSLITFVPTLSMYFRRLHDTGKSAWWLLIALLPGIGEIILLVFCALPGIVGDNQYGSDPTSNYGY